jgi:FAD:protein FMN transferase
MTTGTAPVLATAYRFEAIGTHWEIDTEVQLGDDARTGIHALIEDFDRTWSRFRRDSWVTAVGRRAGSHQLDTRDALLLNWYRELHDATGGAVTPLVGRTLEHLGYDADYRLTPLPGDCPVPAWDDVLRWDGTRLTTVGGQLLDVGAAGKGRLVDLVGAALESLGVHRYVIDAGGDLLHRGDDVLRVALEHPADPRKAIGVVELTNQAICASAGNRRTWAGGLHHVVDPATAAPTRDVIATWAIADRCAVADGLATALFFSDGPALQAALPTVPFSYVRVTARAELQCDAGLPGEVFR